MYYYNTQYTEHEETADITKFKYLVVDSHKSADGSYASDLFKTFDEIPDTFLNSGYKRIYSLISEKINGPAALKTRREQAKDKATFQHLKKKYNW